MSKKAWHISYISAMAGPCTATSEHGMMAWSNDDDYTVRLLDMDNDGEKLLLHIDSETTDEMLSYQLVGYAVINDLPFSTTTWDQFNDC